MMDDCVKLMLLSRDEAKLASACIIKFGVECGEEGKAVPKKKQFSNEKG
jgi:hypothetical protein